MPICWRAPWLCNCNNNWDSPWCSNTSLVPEALWLRSMWPAPNLMVLAAHAINDSLYPKLPYRTRQDFTPVSLVANLPMIVAARACSR